MLLGLLLPGVLWPSISSGRGCPSGQLSAYACLRTIFKNP